MTYKSASEMPAYGVVCAYLTATAVTWSEEDAGDYPDEEHGWVDADWSMRVLHESRNDVKPYAELYLHGDGSLNHDRSTIGRCVTDEDEILTVADFIRATVADALGSAEDNGDGTWYGSDSIVTDYSDPRDYTYALHFHVKHNDGRRGWVEDDVTLD